MWIQCMVGLLVGNLSKICRTFSPCVIMPAVRPELDGDGVNKAGTSEDFMWMC